MTSLSSGTLRLALIALVPLILPLGTASTIGKRVHPPKQLSFEPNLGQTAGEVAFVSHGKRSNLFLTPGKAVLSLLRGDRRLALEMRFKNANPNPRIEGTNQLPGTVNYFAGADARTWRTAIPRYGRVLYRGIYPGIDLTYYGTDRQLEYDFIVAPGADPRAIQLELAGHDKARIDGHGDLVLMAGGHELRQHKPVVYQELDGRREAIDGRYVLRGRTVSFDVGAYDRGRTLVIDPLMGYSSYLGGAGEESGAAVATDPAGNVYLTGGTLSADFPVSPGTYQNTKPAVTTSPVVYVTKIDPDGEKLIYSAYVASGTSTGLAVDAAGNAYITGRPNGNFPVTPGAAGSGSGAFVTKLSPDGAQLLYSTIVPGATFPESIELDRNGAAYISGQAGLGLKTTPGALQPAFPGSSSKAGFVAKINPDGKSFGFVTYFGGPGRENAWVRGIAVDLSGNAYITGHTRATDLPVTANAPQPKLPGTENTFVFKLNAAGSAVLFGTYMGGSGSDFGRRIALDGTGNIYVAGETSCDHFPATPGAYRTACQNSGAFVVKYSPDYKLLFSTYIARVDDVTGLAVDSAGNSYLTGQTGAATDLKVTSDAVKGKPIQEDGEQAWVAKLDPTGTHLLYGTYFGGTRNETSVAIAVDLDGSIYITGNTLSPNLPVALNPVQKALSNDQHPDAYVAQFSEPPWFDADHVANGASFSGGAVAAGEIITLYGFSLGPKVLKTYNITAGKFDTTLGRTKITFDGVPAPIIYSNWGQTSIVVPYAVAGKATTQVVVEYKGRVGAPVTLQVVDAAPGIFTASANGSGQGAILLENYSVNGAGNAVPRGRAAMVYMTVGGESGIDGMLATGISQHSMAVTATVGGVDAQVIYAGPSPGLIWGLTQVNVIVPAGAPVGPAVPLVITFGTRSTQTGVTMAVK